MLQLVAIPKEAYGKFYDGDSYIIYAASEKDQPCGPDIPVGFYIPFLTIYCLVQFGIKLLNQNSVFVLPNTRFAIKS